VTQQVEVNGQNYLWTAEDGLDTAAVLELHRWIVTIALNYRRKAELLNFDMTDLIQAGYIGALRAAATYDPTKGASYITWATYKITEEISEQCRWPIVESIENREIADVSSFADAELEMEVSKYLSAIPTSDRDILAHRFGLHGRDAKPFRQLAHENHVAPSTTQQKINAALCQIRRTHQVDPN